MTDWNIRWLDLAQQIASWSKDSTQVGCVIVGSANQILTQGYNGFPRGIDDDVPERHQRPVKYLWTEHAERNAIYNAARHGIKLEGATIYLPWFPCADCARAIIQVGIEAMIAIMPDLDHPKWGEDFRVALAMLDEAGIDIRYEKNYPA